MKNQEYTLLDTHPVLLNTVLPDFNIARDWAEGEVEMRQLIDTYEGRLFLVLDVRQMNMTFDDLILGASMGSRGTAPIWHHPKVQGIYFISDSKLVAMIAKGLHSPVFGNTAAKACGTVEEALADIERMPSY